MSEQIKKPLYKKWWVWLIGAFIIGGILTAITGEDEAKEVDKEPKQEVEKEETEKEEPEEDALSDEVVELIKSNLEDSLESDRELGDMFYLDDFEYNPDSNKILARIDMQQDPLPETKEDVADWAETWAWSMAETNPDVKDKFNIQVALVTKFDKDEYGLWGYSSYNADTKEYTFKEEDGMKLYD